MAVAIIILIGTIIAVLVDIGAITDGSIWATHICASIGRARGCSAFAARRDVSLGYRPAPPIRSPGRVGSSVQRERSMHGRLACTARFIAQGGYEPRLRAACGRGFVRRTHLCMHVTIVLIL